MTIINKQILLVSRPQGVPTPENFRLVEVPLPAITDGQVLVRNHFLSVDPYMRARMNDAKSYASPQALDEVMTGGTAGEVLESKHPDFVAGDAVLGFAGWQEHVIVDATQVSLMQKVDTSRIPLSAYLGTMGMPGVTAWYGLMRIIKPKAEETVVVSAAAGAVGTVVGQLAKARGCRVIGLAGGPDKCRYVHEELGFDGCIDYKQYRDVQALRAVLKETCPKGIDGYFENVGGLILEAILPRMNTFGRVAVCGMISGYNGTPIPIPIPQWILQSRLRVQGFIISDHMEVWPEALQEIKTLVAEGRIKSRETIAQGLTATPDAFLGLFQGKNFGKQLVKLI